MSVYIGKRRFGVINRIIIVFVVFSLFFGSVIPGPAFAQSISMLNLPVPGAMVMQSQAFVPVLLKGMTIHADDPFKFDFIVDSGNTGFSQDEIQLESEKLVKYFLASMTVPKDDLWVNLSPYEGDRIIPDELGKTELGRDLLAQDYILKQLTASLMYPEDELGSQFWERIYQKAQEQFATTDIPVNTFNKVWILPESATVYENGNTVFVVESKLKVMLDSDYLAMANDERLQAHANSDLDLQSNIVREIIIPEIEKEVNEGANFASLRQIYHSLILAKWYKETIKNSLLSAIYIDQNKTVGVELDDIAFKEEIYQRYLAAYKKGVFDYIKQDYDVLTDQVIDRKYFSGGFADKAMLIDKTNNREMIGRSVTGKTFTFEMGIKPEIKRPDVAMLSGKRILVVDDDLDLREMFRDLLGFQGVDVVVAEDGQQAFDILQTDKDFALVLTDLEMPNMTGDQLARKVSETNIGIPVLLHTGRSDRVPELSEALSGIATVMKKAMDMNMFFAAVEKASTPESDDPDKAMLSGKRILVVDDTKTILTIMRTLLEDENAEVVTAPDGKDALELLKDDSRFDLIISDLNMPIVKGDEFAQAVKDTGYGIPVLIQTANSKEVINALSEKLDGIARVIEKGGLANLYEEINRFISPDKYATADRSMLSGKRILVVDDDLSLREIMEMLFQARKATVVKAENGQQALDILRDDKDFDLIFTDYQMPVINGIELSKKVSESNIGIPILMQTASVEEIPQITEELSGIATVIKKGQSITEIIQAAVDSIEGVVDFKKDSDMLPNINTVEPLIRDPELRDFIEEFLTKRYSRWGLPQDLAKRIISKLVDNVKDIDFARKKVYQDVIDFDNNEDWNQAYERYKTANKYDDTYDQIKEHIEGLLDGSLVVDLGAGNNVLGAVMAKRLPGIKIVGVDVLDYHEESDLPNLGYLKQSSPTQFPSEIQPNSVDVITMNAFFHHVSSELVDDLIEDIKRVLKPGGKIVLIEDTYSIDLNADSNSDADLNSKFVSLVKKHGSGFAKDFFAFNDWYANILVHGWDEMAVPYEFRSIEELQILFQRKGFDLGLSKHIGFPSEGFHKPGLGVVSFSYEGERSDIAMLAGKRVLVVDDYPGILRATQRILMSQDVAVVTAKDGQEAYDILQKDREFDLVLSDLEMPNMTGAQLARRISDEGMGIPVLIQTGRIEFVEQLSSELNGIAAVMEKTGGRDVMLQAVENAIGDSAMLSQEAMEKLSQMHVTADDVVQLSKLSDQDWAELIVQLNKARVVTPITNDINSDIFGIYIDESQSEDMTPYKVRNVFERLAASFRKEIQMVVFTELSRDTPLVYEGLHKILFVSRAVFLGGRDPRITISPVYISGEILQNNRDPDLMTIKDLIRSGYTDKVQNSDVGGINMNNIDLERTGEGLNIEFSPSDLEPMINMGIKGFSPVIINLAPLNSVFPILGLDSRNEEEELEISKAN